jgi:hypothetical protein
MANIELVIEGVPDRAIENAIRKRVRAFGRRLQRSGDCRVCLGPSEVRGEWDLGIRGALRWHLASFAAPVAGLPDVVERTLDELGIGLALDS